MERKRVRDKKRERRKQGDAKIDKKRYQETKKKKFKQTKAE